MKRIIDIILSATAIISLSPIFIIVGIAIRIDSPGPLIFKQTRIGLNEVPFSIYKFRTMKETKESRGPSITVEGDPRITKIGKILRKYKLDEFPQLFNVVRGDMSLVGPRPEVPEFISYYPSEDRRIIFSVRPGITDFASIEYFNENEILGGTTDPIRKYIKDILPVKIKYHKYYALHHNTITDITIILRTLSRLVK